MYRITGDQYWADSGWDMFKAIEAQTKTELGHSTIRNVLSPAPKYADKMESFWLAETLKYFYLLFSETNVVNLDEYVL
jgi:mannosyl-oligosaccharide alpha-1,2-mannosidase